MPGGYRLASLLTSDPTRLTPEEQLFVTRLLSEEPALNIAVTWAKRMNTLLRRKSEESLDEVLDAARGTLLGRFAAGLHRDFAAIRAAIDLPWTTSPVEGQISRLKMLKRTMYGRAGFSLLRARVLNPV